MMKQLFLIIFFFLVKCSFSQDISVSLERNEAMPDVLIGNVLEQNGEVSLAYFGSGRFAALRNKLVIFDFWTTGCSACINGFQKMAKLQRQFGEKIQIMLVNPWQDAEHVKSWMDRTDVLIPNNLPMIVGAKELGRLFPVRIGVPYHVWINRGTFIFRGLPVNTHHRKIDQVLKGASVLYLEDYAGSLNFKKRPFFLTANPESQFNADYNSAFSSQFIDTLIGSYGAHSIDVVDTVKQLYRTTLLNASIYRLFSVACASKLKRSSLLYGNKFLFENVPDSLVTIVENNFERYPTTDDSLRISCKYSYEQSLPLNTTQEARERIMLTNLNMFLSQEANVIGNIEMRRLSAFRLVVRDSVVLKGREVKGKLDGENGVTVTLKKLFDIGINWSLSNAALVDFNGIIVDATGFSGYVRIPTMPTLSTMNEFKAFLWALGLDLIRGEVEVEVLVIRGT